MSDDLEAIYAAHCRSRAAMAAHLPRLRELAALCDDVVEFGVKGGASSSALLLGARRSVTSYDIAPTRQAYELKAVAGERWDYRIEDSRHADVPACDLLLIDSLHDYACCHAELFKHGNKARSLLVFHDHITFGVIGALGETGTHKWQYVRGQSVPLNCLGIRQAIDEFQIANPHWRIAASYPESHGLLVLRRES